jgi:hypothetical protein
MSLSLLATTIVDRLLRPGSARPLALDSPLRPQRRSLSPHDDRARLRREVLARGGVLADIETIHGDCPAQTARQIADLTRWLDAQRVV